MDRNISRRSFVGAGIGALSAIALAACANEPADPAPQTPSGSEESQAKPASIRVASLKGPTSIGLADLMKRAEEGATEDTYEFTVSAAADEVAPLLIKGDVDIALVPANLASVVFNKTEGGILAIDINTLGVLYVVASDESISSFTDLAGKTVFLTGKGATPEYVMSFLLERAGIASEVTLEFKDEAAEVVSALAADAAAVAVLPEPFVTAALTKNEALSRRLSLTDVWDETAADSKSRLVTGATVVRKAFLEEFPESVLAFIDEHAASVEAVNADPGTYGQVVADLGIVDAAPIATKAIPNCNLVCITGSEMQDALSGYLEVLYGADPASVGGELPTDNFYFLG